MGQVGIRFSGENKLEFIIELRKKVMNYFETNNISKYGNMNIILQTILMFSIYFVPYFLMMLGVIDSFLGVWLGWIVIGLGNAGVGMVTMHDANHQSFSKNPMVNVWMSKTLFLLGGLPETWQYQHNTLHHGFTNIDGHDEDINPGPFLRFSPHKPLYKAHRFQHFYAWFFYALMTISWITTKDFKQLYNYKKRGVSLSSNKSHGQLLAILIVSKILYYGVFMILPLIILPFAWYWIILFFLTMHFTSGFILTIIFQTAHVMPTSQYPLPDESGTIENNWAVHQLFTTSDYAPNNKVLSWLVGGLNYQVEHHLFPDISHVHYHKISGIVKTMAQKYNLPYHVQSGFFKAILEHAKMLKKLGRAYSI